MQPVYSAYWGKARPEAGACFPCHPLPYHALDVAAVGATLLDRDPRLAAHVAARSCLPTPVLRRWLLTWLAWHDLGKFSPAFQRLAPEACAVLGGPASVPCIPAQHRHDAYGFWLLEELYGKRFPVFAGLSQQWMGRHGGQLVQLWSAAVTGHHGTPPCRQPSGVVLEGQEGLFPPAALDAAERFMGDSLDLFAGGTAPLAPADLAATLRMAPRFSWSLAGFAVLCDWIGSGQRWFCYTAPELDLASYWPLALERAGRAVAESGVLPSPAAPRRAARNLLADRRLQALRPLQALVQDMVLPDGPLLVLIEDLTGSGKTEAAALLAHRLIASGRVDGLVMALPTMATANAMYDRVNRFHRGFFADDARPSLVLGHSRAVLRAALEAAAEPEPDFDGDETASAACAAWIADDRRRTLLADVGVVTIDQTILSVLPVRHQSLRLLGLGRKVLIVDEAHAYDSYMLEELARLLEFHAAAGGSAVILSATLPATVRGRLVDGFAKGLGDRATPASAFDEQAAYPLVTVMHRNGTILRDLPQAEPPLRDVAIAWLSPEEACARVVAQARAGGAVCWLRNTVGDAQAAFAALHDAAPELPAMLFHARFAMIDRQTIERAVLEKFGPNSDAAARRGQVLVATQVAEQSLDLDFDALITDLAPIDLVIQRAGRLWRHRRVGRSGRPVLEVVAPPWADDPSAGWYRTAFPVAAFVYPDHARLWLTARTLRAAGAIVLPQQARALIEAVYGHAADEAIPSRLDDSADRAQGVAFAHMAQARDALLTLDSGYLRQNAPWDLDVRVPTRLGEPQAEFRLARWDGTSLRPWADAGDPWLAWRLSEITLRASVAASVPPAAGALGAAVAEEIAKWHDAKYAPALLPLVVDPDGGSWRGTAYSPDKGTVWIRYDRAIGLQVDRDQNQGK